MMFMTSLPVLISEPVEPPKKREILKKIENYTHRIHGADIYTNIKGVY
jgi:hypothetical protein